MIAIAMYQPDMPGNLGAMMRLCACLDLPLHVIEPAGFPLRDEKLKRAAMDYAGRARLVRHADFAAFREACPARLVAMTTRATATHVDFAFREGDILLLGRESSGLPQAVHDIVDEALRIPMRTGERSLNVVNAAAMVVGEALRQLGGYPP
ncbi:MAG: tRNA (cytidine(34)-2'-O)-methyltransferase [Geminicoccaceae bacterium]